jgi:hypothetical protein
LYILLVTYNHQLYILLVTYNHHCLSYYRSSRLLLLKLNKNQWTSFQNIQNNGLTMTRVIRYRMANAVDFCPQPLLPTWSLNISRHLRWTVIYFPGCINADEVLVSKGAITFRIRVYSQLLFSYIVTDSPTKYNELNGDPRLSQVSGNIKTSCR